MVMSFSLQKAVISALNRLGITPALIIAPSDRTAGNVFPVLLADPGQRVGEAAGANLPAMPGGDHAFSHRRASALAQ